MREAILSVRGPRSFSKTVLDLNLSRSGCPTAAMPEIKNVGVTEMLRRLQAIVASALASIVTVRSGGSYHDD